MKLIDVNGIEVMEVAECRRLLAGRSIGRLGVVVGGQPVILPVNYVMAGETVVFRTGPGTKLDHGPGTSACFEIDEFDGARRAGWSVLAVGRLEEITDYDEAGGKGRRELSLTPWAPGERSHWLRLVPRQVTGRRVGGG
jgi:nitroimidazol reductase NimA-like FMN-containing flavoprotein (pyridoxamine 5'-phosphate oxidase superfamily)